MTSIDRIPPRGTAAHRVAVLLFDGMSTFETGIASDVFGLWRDEDGPGYALVLCAERASVRGIGGVTLAASYDLDDLAGADTVIVPGVTDVGAPVPDAVVAALRRAHHAGARVASICSGAFALAAAGLLDGRRATTHWRYAALLARRYPRVSVDPDVLYVDEGRVLTSAGSAAGLDLCLHLVRRDRGAAVAAAVARRMVAPPHRDGGQAQFVPRPVAHHAADLRTAAAMDHATANIAHPWRVEDLARHVGTSSRSFTRHFRSATGTTPIRWLTTQRIAASLPLLEGGDATIEEVARRVGLDAVTYRRHFRAAMGISPSAYRARFADRGPRGAP